MLEAVSSPSCFAVKAGQEVVVAGGKNADHDAVDRVQIFNFASNAWRNASELQEIFNVRICVTR